MKKYALVLSVFLVLLFINQQAFSFEPKTVVDGNDQKWASYFIFDRDFKSCGNSVLSPCHVNISEIETPYGKGVQVDTSKSLDHGYWFFGYSEKYLAPNDGLVTISGKFLKKDTIHDSLLEGRSNLTVFILSADVNEIIHQQDVLTAEDERNVWFEKETSFTLSPEEEFRVGIGRVDSWGGLMILYAAWANVKINAEKVSDTGVAETPQYKKQFYIVRENDDEILEYFSFDGLVTNEGCKTIGGKIVNEYRDHEKTQPIRFCDYSDKRFRVADYDLCILQVGVGVDPDTGKQITFPTPCDVPTSCDPNYTWGSSSSILRHYDLRINIEPEEYQVVVTSVGCVHEFFDYGEKKIVVNIQGLDRVGSYTVMEFLIPLELLDEKFEIFVNKKQIYRFDLIIDDKNKSYSTIPINCFAPPCEQPKILLERGERPFPMNIATDRLDAENRKKHYALISFTFVPTTIEATFEIHGTAGRVIDKNIPAPKKQITTGVKNTEINCKVGLQLIFKSSDNSPACVKPSTVEKLIERGWGSFDNIQLGKTWIATVPTQGTNPWSYDQNKIKKYYEEHGISVYDIVILAADYHIHSDAIGGSTGGTLFLLISNSDVQKMTDAGFYVVQGPHKKHHDDEKHPMPL